MKPEHKRYILENRGKKSVAALARDLDLREKVVRRFLEEEDRKKGAAPAGPSRPAPLDKKKLWLSVLLIVCVGGLVYANSLKGKFLWDDSNLIMENRYIRQWTTIPAIFSKDIGAGAENQYHFYRPLQILTYLFDYTVWHMNPAGYHLGNILYHVSAALVLFWLIFLLFGDHLLALLTSLLFVTHPVHTEAVTYIAGRADPLSTLFILLAFVFYIKAQEGRKAPLILLAAFSYACALLARENSLIAPVLLLLYHVAFRKKIRIPHFAAMTVLAILYIVLLFTLLAYLLNYKAHSTTMFDRLPGFFAALVSYIRILILPFHLHMEYGGWPFSWAHPKVFLGLVVLLALLFVIFREKAKRGLVFFSFAWFLIVLVPVSNLYPLNAFMAEHWLYLPSIGFFLIIAKAFSSWLRRDSSKRIALAGFIGLTALWSVLTVRQNTTWLEPIPFFTRTLRYAPASSRTYNALGMAYNDLGQCETGASYLEKAVQLSDGAAVGDAVKAYNNLALVYNKLGKNDQAAEIAKEAISRDATHAQAYNNLAISYVRMGKYEEAIEACKKALAQKPDYAKAYNTMAAALMNLGKYDESMAIYHKIIELTPEYPEAHNNLGLLLQRMGRPGDAIPWHVKAAELRPDYTNAYCNLGNAYLAVGKLDEAEAAYKKTLELEPKRAEAYINLAKICLKRGQSSEAAAYRDKAKALGVSDADIQKMMGSGS